MTSLMQNSCLNKMSLISWLRGANSTSTFLPEKKDGATKAANVFVKAAVSSHDRKDRTEVTITTTMLTYERKVVKLVLKLLC